YGTVMEADAIPRLLDISETEVFDSWVDESGKKVTFTKKIKSDYKVYSSYETIAQVEALTSIASLDSIQVKVHTTDGSNDIVKYYYSINDEEYIESTENTFTFDELDNSTNYKVKVKVMDSKNRFSLEYSEDIATSTYDLPQIDEVFHAQTYDSLTIDVVATVGSAAIQKYMFSIDGGENWTTIYSDSMDASCNFQNLLANTSFVVKVKVVDVNEKESDVYSVDVMTSSRRNVDFSNKFPQVKIQ
ncbi:MAG: hypothetical protein K2M17_00580, partial [Bacilli bacterium]|nr:hypothetical protein [Bacilli bacterium]